MEADELLERLAQSLRHEIGPVVGEPFAKTQAFMASVVLEKVAGQLRCAADHRQADEADRLALVNDVEAAAGSNISAGVSDAVSAVRQGEKGLSSLVENLYAECDELGSDLFEQLLGRVRETLRARLDRQLEYSA